MGHRYGVKIQAGSEYEWSFEVIQPSAEENIAAQSATDGSVGAEVRTCRCFIRERWASNCDCGCGSEVVWYQPTLVSDGTLAVTDRTQGAVMAG